MSATGAPFEQGEHIHSIFDFSNYIYLGTSRGLYGGLDHVARHVKYRKDGTIKQSKDAEVIRIGLMKKGWKTKEEQDALRQKKKEEQEALSKAANAAAKAEANAKKAKTEAEMQEAERVIKEGSEGNKNIVCATMYTILDPTVIQDGILLSKYLQDDSIQKYFKDDYGNLCQLIHPQIYLDRDRPPNGFNYHYSIRRIKDNHTDYHVIPDYFTGEQMTFIREKKVCMDITKHSSGGYAKSRRNRKLTKRKRTTSRRNRQ